MKNSSQSIEARYSYIFRSEQYKSRLSRQLINLVDQVIPPQNFIYPAYEINHAEFKGLRFSTISPKELTKFFLKDCEASYSESFWYARSVRTIGILAELLIDLRDRSGVHLTYNSIRNVISIESLKHYYENDINISKKVRESLLGLLDELPGNTQQEKERLYVMTYHLQRILEQNFKSVDNSIQKIINKHAVSQSGVEALVEINNTSPFMPAKEFVDRLEQNGIDCSRFYHLFSLQRKGELLDSAMGL